MTTEPRCDLADYCECLPDGSRRPCYAWAMRVRGRYLVLERDEWEARGAGYRGAMLGG